MRATVSLEGQLLEWPPHNPDRWWAGNCSADPRRGSIGLTRMRPRKLGNRAAANYRFLNGSPASAVCPDRSSRVTSLGPPSTLWGALGVRCCHSLEFGQDRHFLKVLGAEARPVDARRCGAGALDADRVG